MADAAVDAAGQQIGVRLEPSRAAEVPPIGAEGLDAARAALTGWKLGAGVADRLVKRYGALAVEVAAPAERDATLAATLPGAAPYLAAEAVYAVSQEGALRLDDVLSGRTRISIEAPDRGHAAAPIVAELIAGPLGWSTQRQRDEVAGYRGQRDVERAAEISPYDPDKAAVARS